MESVELIKIVGDNSTNGATIITDVNGTFIARINGSNDAVYSIYCNASDVCKIDCQVSGSCDNLQPYCYGLCLIDCNVMNGIICPNVTTGNWSYWNTFDPTVQPSLFPSNNPSINPSGMPSNMPTVIPSQQPSDHPSSNPTLNPSFIPTSVPTGIPTTNPTHFPSAPPTYNPTS